MILDWAASSPVVLVAAALVLIPGALLLRGTLRLRGLALWASAPVASVAMVVIAALVLGFTPVSWSPLSLAIALLVMVLAGWGLGRLLGRPVTDETTSGARWFLPLGIALGVVFGGWRLIAYIQDPAGISQTNDSVFHMNAIRYVLDTADASSLHISAVIGGTGFYPAAWHAIVSTVVMLTGSEIAVAANAVTLVIGAVIWPLGVAWLTRTVTGSRTTGAMAAILSPALQMFPLLMFPVFPPPVRRSSPPAPSGRSPRGCQSGDPATATAPAAARPGPRPRALRHRR